MPSYAVLDTETTGFSPYSDRVIEIGVVGLRPDGSVEGTWSTLLNPQHDLGAQHVHGIRSDDVAEAPLFVDIAGDLAEVLRGRCFVGHNAPFDARFIAAEFDRAGAPTSLVGADCLCTMQLARALLPGRKKTLDACCTELGIHHYDAHSALGDAQATAELLQRLASRAGGFPTLCREMSLDDRAARVIWPCLPARHTPHVQRGGRS
jgi:DNA polymerase-3 subunit epsilon